MENGWIKLHRKIQDSGLYSKPTYFLIWIHLLLSANHRPKKFIWNGKDITVREGQLITGRKKISEALEIPESTVERALGYLEDTSKIGQQKTTKYRLITISKWHQYQLADNKRTTNGQQTDTNKNVIKKEYTRGRKQVSPNSKKKDMFNKKSDDYLEGEVDLDTGDLTPLLEKKRKKKYPNSKAVYSIFENVLSKKTPANWLVNKTQLQAAENLSTERGLPQIKKALVLYQERKDEKYCPHISSPYDLDSKWSKLYKFIKE